MTELSVISISILLISIVSFFFSPLEKNYVRVFYTSVYYYGLETFSYSSESTASSRWEPLFSGTFFSSKETKREEQTALLGSRTLNREEWPF